MDLERVFREHLSSWITQLGPEGDVVLSSRIRLARNLEGILFTSIAPEEQLLKVLGMVDRFVAKSKRKFRLVRLEGIDEISRQELVEKHLISPEHAEASPVKGVVVNPAGDISIMVNEEDHLRIQVLKAGLDLHEAYKLADVIDDELAAALPVAYSVKRGYLTACPTNVGTGLRASVMLHLPGVVYSGQTNQIASICGKLGLVIRGLYGEGTAPTGEIFQVSNQVTLGYSEEEIMAHLTSFCEQIIAEERRLRQLLWESKQDELEDQIFRALGTLSFARSMTTNEAMELLSRVKLGIDLGIIPKLNSVILKELMVVIRPALLQKIVGQPLSPQERDLRRAGLIRERLSQINS